MCGMIPNPLSTGQDGAPASGCRSLERGMKGKGITRSVPPPPFISRTIAKSSERHSFFKFESSRLMLSETCVRFSSQHQYFPSIISHCSLFYQNALECSWMTSQHWETTQSDSHLLHSVRKIMRFLLLIMDSLLIFITSTRLAWQQRVFTNNSLLS